MSCVIDNDPPSQSLHFGERYHPSWLQTSGECVLHFMKDRMSSSIIGQYLRIEGNLGIDPKVKLYQLISSLYNLEEKDLKS
jgi:hypothetical protein